MLWLGLGFWLIDGDEITLHAINVFGYMSEFVVKCIQHVMVWISVLVN
jgi:hypothetical protein